MSPSESVAARVAAAIQTGDLSPLTTAEAEADAIALLRVAAPRPGQDMDNAALATACRMFALRSLAGGSDADGCARIVAAIVGVLPPDAGVDLSADDRAKLDSLPPVWREGVFAALAARAHSRGAVGDQAGRLETALAWSSRAWAMLGQTDDLSQLGPALTHRITLLNSRARLAADPDAWAEAADVGRALAGVLSPEQAAHGPYLAAGAEAIVRATLFLGDPAREDAERAAALVPADHRTRVTTELLRTLKAVHDYPVSWPGEPDARIGVGLLKQGQAQAHAGVIAAASRRLRAALAATPSDHPAHPELILEIRKAAVAFAVAGGPGLPADVVLAAFVVDLRGSGSTVTDGWLAGYESAFARLSPDHPSLLEYAVTRAAANGVRADLIRSAEPGRADQLADQARQILDGLSLPEQCTVTITMRAGLYAQSLAFAGCLTPWPALATPGELGEAFQATNEALGGSDGLPGAFRDLFFLDLAPDADSARAETYRRLAALAEQIPDDRQVRRATLIAMMGATLSSAASLRADPEIAREAADLILRAFTIDPSIQQNQGFVGAFAAALTLDPGRVLNEWDAQQRLAATALLASMQDTGLVQLELAKTMGEILVAAMTLATQRELSQRQRIHDLADRARDLARRGGPETEDQYVPVLDVFVAMVDANADVAAALPEFRGAEVQAAAVAGFRQQLAALPAEHRMRPLIESLLGIQLRAQATVSPDDPAAIQLRAEADSLISRALAAMPAQQAALVGSYVGADSPLRSEKRTAKIHAAFGEAADHPEAFRALITDPRIPVRDRIHEGLTTAIQVIPRAEILHGLGYAELAVELMSQVADRGIDHESAEHTFAGLMPAHPERYVSGLLTLLRLARQEVARRSPELVAELAPMQDQIVARAAALAERARGVLLARQFESRTDLGELEAEYPGLAGEYTRVVTELGADPDTLAELRPASDPPAVGRPEWARLEKLRLSGELDALIEQIRHVPGFGTFQRGLDPLQMRALAADGPVVLLAYPGWPGMTPDENFGKPCAFIVTTESIKAFQLADDFREFDAAAARWRAAIVDITARGARRPGIARLRQARQDLTEVLSWTWHHVTGPVLEAAGLGSRDEAAGGWSRVWWIPDGSLNALPLHAAQCQLPGCDLAGCGAALDLVVSSYIPSFRTLAHVRSRGVGDSGSGPAVIVAAGDDELPGAEAAAREAAQRLGAGPDEVLVGDAATRERVLAMLGDSTWAHFGCHATSDPRQPSSGTLHLPNGETLTVREIFAGRSGIGRTGPARLAFLTACGTARTSQRLATEAIHLTSAFLVVGFTEAIGTLWEIDSVSARQVSSAFYERVTGPSPQPAALALHHCVRQLRRQRPTEPHTWAAYIHSGA
jgi:hypothetical protein